MDPLSGEKARSLTILKVDSVIVFFLKTLLIISKYDCVELQTAASGKILKICYTYVQLI